MVRGQVMKDLYVEPIEKHQFLDISSSYPYRLKEKDELWFKTH